METTGRDQVLVQVVDARAGREIGWGANLAEELSKRLDDIRTAIAAGAATVAGSLEGLPAAQGWQLGEVSASFGVTLTAEAGVLLSKASAGATFEVQVKFVPTARSRDALMVDGGQRKGRQRAGR